MIQGNQGKLIVITTRRHNVFDLTEPVGTDLSALSAFTAISALTTLPGNVCIDCIFPISTF